MHLLVAVLLVAAGRRFCEAFSFCLLPSFIRGNGRFNLSKRNLGSHRRPVVGVGGPSSRLPQSVCFSSSDVESKFPVSSFLDLSEEKEETDPRTARKTESSEESTGQWGETEKSGENEREADDSPAVSVTVSPPHNFSPVPSDKRARKGRWAKQQQKEEEEEGGGISVGRWRELTETVTSWAHWLLCVSGSESQDAKTKRKEEERHLMGMLAENVPFLEGLAELSEELSRLQTEGGGAVSLPAVAGRREFVYVLIRLVSGLSVISDLLFQQALERPRGESGEEEVENEPETSLQGKVIGALEGAVIRLCSLIEETPFESLERSDETERHIATDSSAEVPSRSELPFPSWQWRKPALAAAGCGTLSLLAWRRLPSSSFYLKENEFDGFRLPSAFSLPSYSSLLFCNLSEFLHFLQNPHRHEGGEGEGEGTDSLPDEVSLFLLAGGGREERTVAEGKGGGISLSDVQMGGLREAFNLLETHGEGERKGRKQGAEEASSLPMSLPPSLRCWLRDCLALRTAKTAASPGERRRSPLALELWESDALEDLYWSLSRHEHEGRRGGVSSSAKALFQEARRIFSLSSALSAGSAMSFVTEGRELEEWLDSVQWGEEGNEEDIETASCAPVSQELTHAGAVLSRSLLEAFLKREDGLDREREGEQQCGDREREVDDGDELRVLGLMLAVGGFLRQERVTLQASPFMRRILSQLETHVEKLGAVVEQQEKERDEREAEKAQGNIEGFMKWWGTRGWKRSKKIQFTVLSCLLKDARPRLHRALWDLLATLRVLRFGSSLWNSLRDLCSSVPTVVGNTRPIDAVYILSHLTERHEDNSVRQQLYVTDLTKKVARGRRPKRSQSDEESELELPSMDDVVTGSRILSIAHNLPQTPVLPVDEPPAKSFWKSALRITNRWVSGWAGQVVETWRANSKRVMQEKIQEREEEEGVSSSDEVQAVGDLSVDSPPVEDLEAAMEVCSALQKYLGEGQTEDHLWLPKRCLYILRNVSVELAKEIQAAGTAAEGEENSDRLVRAGQMGVRCLRLIRELPLTGDPEGEQKEKAKRERSVFRLLNSLRVFVVPVIDDRPTLVDLLKSAWQLSPNNSGELFSDLLSVLGSEGVLLRPEAAVEMELGGVGEVEFDYRPRKGKVPFSCLLDFADVLGSLFESGTLEANQFDEFRQETKEGVWVVLGRPNVNKERGGSTGKLERVSAEPEALLGIVRAATLGSLSRWPNWRWIFETEKNEEAYRSAVLDGQSMRMVMNTVTISKATGSFDSPGLLEAFAQLDGVAKPSADSMRWMRGSEALDVMSVLTQHVKEAGSLREERRRVRRWARLYMCLVASLSYRKNPFAVFTEDLSFSRLKQKDGPGGASVGVNWLPHSLAAMIESGIVFGDWNTLGTEVVERAEFVTHVADAFVSHAETQIKWGETESEIDSEALEVLISQLASMASRIGGQKFFLGNETIRKGWQSPRFVEEMQKRVLLVERQMNLIDRLCGLIEEGGTGHLRGERIVTLVSALGTMPLALSASLSPFASKKAKATHAEALLTALRRLISLIPRVSHQLRSFGSRLSDSSLVGLSEAMFSIDDQVGFLIRKFTGLGGSNEEDEKEVLAGTEEEEQGADFVKELAGEWRELRGHWQEVIRSLGIEMSKLKRQKAMKTTDLVTLVESMSRLRFLPDTDPAALLLYPSVLSHIVARWTGTARQIVPVHRWRNRAAAEGGHNSVEEPEPSFGLLLSVLSCLVRLLSSKGNAMDLAIRSLLVPSVPRAQTQTLPQNRIENGDSGRETSEEEDDEDRAREADRKAAAELDAVPNAVLSHLFDQAAVRRSALQLSSDGQSDEWTEAVTGPGSDLADALASGTHAVAFAETRLARALGGGGLWVVEGGAVEGTRGESEILRRALESASLSGMSSDGLEGAVGKLLSLLSSRAERVTAQGQGEEHERGRSKVEIEEGSDLVPSVEELVESISLVAMIALFVVTAVRHWRHQYGEEDRERAAEIPPLPHKALISQLVESLPDFLQSHLEALESAVDRGNRVGLLPAREQLVLLWSGASLGLFAREVLAQEAPEVEEEEGIPFFSLPAGPIHSGPQLECLLWEGREEEGDGKGSPCKETGKTSKENEGEHVSGSSATSSSFWHVQERMKALACRGHVRRASAGGTKNNFSAVPLSWKNFSLLDKADFIFCVGVLESLRVRPEGSSLGLRSALIDVFDSPGGEGEGEGGKTGPEGWTKFFLQEEDKGEGGGALSQRVRRRGRKREAGDGDGGEEEEIPQAMASYQTRVFALVRLLWAVSERGAAPSFLLEDACAALRGASSLPSQCEVLLRDVETKMPGGRHLPPLMANFVPGASSLLRAREANRRGGKIRKPTVRGDRGRMAESAKDIFLSHRHDGTVSSSQEVEEQKEERDESFRPQPLPPLPAPPRRQSLPVGEEVSPSSSSSSSSGSPSRLINGHIVSPQGGARGSTAKPSRHQPIEALTSPPPLRPPPPSSFLHNVPRKQPASDSSEKDRSPPADTLRPASKSLPPELPPPPVSMDRTGNPKRRKKKGKSRSLAKKKLPPLPAFRPSSRRHIGEESGPISLT
uniref:VWFA domain-containing protein n=1 Tax=Chromera velia CCMP2878 TaxID=1169474 RepID=A0A0G4HWP3_9ALVE|eukprot:Cvel_9080.t1-p1 / transcript=Cvel_9080.t1 / gene=Cvel_9080 / organism=Chromera_velia_CCMP2878 / gene_product=hypothetical protein / transcript_product=hypothetical protein / location=Cvel_scaffold515:29297-41165(+) / protein_length=2567 / sequence_SO=supercontig / SO=protein_coding / is_pseudo=false